MKKSTVLFITSLLVLPAFADEISKPNDRELRQARITATLQGAAENCALIDFLDRKIEERLSPTEKSIKNNLRLMYNEASLISTDSMTVSEYLQVLKSKNNQGLTIKEIAHDNTPWFSFGVCYRMARTVEWHEKELINLESEGYGNKIVRLSPDLKDVLKN